MGLFSKLFGGKGKKDKDKQEEQEHEIVRRDENPDVVMVKNEDERMDWAIEKANYTLHHFKDCLSSPKENQNYFSLKARIEDDHAVEHIWLGEPEYDAEGSFYGVVGNVPLNLTNVKLGDRVGVSSDHVSDWMIVEEGRLIGGYTIRALRDAYPAGPERDAFDEQVGLYVDYGEDYFPVDLSTPEGAILSLEAAYQAKDRAIACKDFRREGMMMLEKLGPAVDEEMIAQMAEVLQMAFVNSLEENGFPELDGLNPAFPRRQQLSDDLFQIQEVCKWPDGKYSLEEHYVAKTPDGWKVMNTVDEENMMGPG